MSDERKAQILSWTGISALGVASYLAFGWVGLLACIGVVLIMVALSYVA